MKPNAQEIRFAALLGFFGVALGAFGAHGLEPTLIANGTLDEWKTASHYHLIHAVVLLVLGFFSADDFLSRLASRSIQFGVLIFSGSLYVFSVTGVRGFAHLTPIGGLLFLVGWLLIAVRRWPRS